jgi:hypothetical protein
MLNWLVDGYLTTLYQLRIFMYDGEVKAVFYFFRRPCTDIAAKN